MKFKTNGLSENFPIMITKRQQNKIDKAIKEKVGFIFRMNHRLRNNLRIMLFRCPRITNY